MFSKIILVFLGISFAGQGFDSIWQKTGDKYILKLNPAVTLSFGESGRFPAVNPENMTDKELKSQMKEFKKTRQSFGAEPKITDWRVAGSGVEDDGKQKWILMEGSFKNPTGEMEHFYEIHYYKSGKSKVAAIHFPEKVPEDEVKSAVKSVRDKMSEQ